MKNKYIIIFTLFTLVINLSCCCRYEPEGIYVAKDNKNMTDTLLIMRDGTYIQKICDMNGNIVLKHKETWKECSINMICMDYLFLDSDSLYNYADPSYRYRDDLMSLTLNYDEKNGQQVIYWSFFVDLPETYHYYYKIANKIN